MKKVKITLKDSSPGKKFFLFPSAEALYVWACAIERGETLAIDGIEELVLEPGGFIEAELRGFEYVYEGTEAETLKHKRLDLVRLAKAHQTQNASGLEAQTYAGWVLGSMLPMKPYSDAHIEVKPLSAEEALLDLASLFNDEIPITTEE